MKCLNCNCEISVDSNFCEFCGSKVEKNSFCSNCGSKLEGNFCSNCGMKGLNDEVINSNVSSSLINDNSVDKKIILNVTRQKKAMGFAVPFTVHVDDIVVGKLKNGCTLSCDIKPGHHVVNIESVEKNTIQEIEVSENMSSVEIVCVAKIGFIAATAKLVDVIYK